MKNIRGCYDTYEYCENWKVWRTFLIFWILKYDFTSFSLKYFLLSFCATIYYYQKTIRMDGKCLRINNTKSYKTTKRKCQLYLMGLSHQLNNNDNGVGSQTALNYRKQKSKILEDIKQRNFYKHYCLFLSDWLFGHLYRKVHFSNRWRKSNHS